MAGLNYENCVEDTVIATFLADAYFISNPVEMKRWHADGDDKVLPVVLVHCHEVKSYEKSTVVLEGKIEITIRTKIPDDLDQDERDEIYQNIMRIVKGDDIDIFNGNLPASPALAFNGFAEIASDENFNDEKREQDMIIKIDSRFWLQ